MILTKWKYISLFIFFQAFVQPSFTQVYPSFSNEIPVTITGLNSDAMEPFISPDGNTIFFNSLNDGINTSLYYASRINDSTFSFAGQVLNVNQIPPHLDAVASVDYNNRFYWISTRDYPSVYENMMVGDFLSGSVTNIKRIYGNIYIFSPGWLIMDAAIDYTGNFLFYCNAYFNNCSSGLPCYSQLGISLKINDTTFVKLPQSDSVLQNVNDTNYLIYAPQASSDLLELYFTRILKGTSLTEICVSVRNNPTGTFSIPFVIYSDLPQIPEAPTLSADKSKLYYHKKTGSYYSIFLRYRSENTGIISNDIPDIEIYPNPTNNMLFVNIPETEEIINAGIYDLSGQTVFSKSVKNPAKLDISGLKPGIYLIKIFSENKFITNKKLIIN